MQVLPREMAELYCPSTATRFHRIEYLAEGLKTATREAAPEPGRRTAMWPNRVLDDASDGFEKRQRLGQLLPFEPLLAVPPPTLLLRPRARARAVLRRVV
jgi:hypothetical protein